jgi:hypothetical protein
MDSQQMWLEYLVAADRCAASAVSGGSQGLGMRSRRLCPHCLPLRGGSPAACPTLGRLTGRSGLPVRAIGR